jgi:hypothetical protein
LALVLSLIDSLGASAAQHTENRGDRKTRMKDRANTPRKNDQTAIQIKQSRKNDFSGHGHETLFLVAGFFHISTNADACYR